MELFNMMTSVHKNGSTNLRKLESINKKKELSFFKEKIILSYCSVVYFDCLTAFVRTHSTVYTVYCLVFSVYAHWLRFFLTKNDPFFPPPPVLVYSCCVVVGVWEREGWCHDYHDACSAYCEPHVRQTTERWREKKLAGKLFRFDAPRERRFTNCRLGYHSLKSQLLRLFNFLSTSCLQSKF